MWGSCWGRSPRVTPDGAPCCCTPSSRRTPGSWSRFSAACHSICSQTAIAPPSRSCCRRRRAAGPPTTATDPPSCSHATGEPQRHLATRGQNNKKTKVWRSNRVIIPRCARRARAESRALLSLVSYWAPRKRLPPCLAKDFPLFFFPLCVLVEARPRAASPFIYYSIRFRAVRTSRLRRFSHAGWLLNNLSRCCWGVSLLAEAWVSDQAVRRYHGTRRRYRSQVMQQNTPPKKHAQAFPVQKTLVKFQWCGRSSK